MPNGGIFTHPPQDELSDLICERLWIDRKMHERLCDLVVRHFKAHQKWPNVVFMPDRFKKWFNRRGADRLDFEIEGRFLADDGRVPEGLMICGGPAGMDLAVGYREETWGGTSGLTNLSAMYNVDGLQTFLPEPGFHVCDGVFIVPGYYPKGEKDA